MFKKAYNYLFNADEILHGRRLPWIDYAKGIAIVLVVYHHAFLGLLSAGISVSQPLINANLIVYSFRMPLFFILSGLFVEQSLRKRGLKKYLGYRSSILLYPYLIWAFIQVTLQIIFGKYANFPATWENYFFIFYDPKYVAQFWYLIALFNVSVLYVLLKDKLRFKTSHHIVLGLILYLGSPALSFNSMLQEIAINYIYLVLGTQISSQMLDKKNFKYFASWKLFLVLLPLFIISQMYWLRHQDIDPFFISVRDTTFRMSWFLQQDMKMLSFAGIVLVGCLFMINICFMLQKIGRASFIKVIGYHSLYIYIMHIIIIGGCRTILLGEFGINDAGILLTILISVSVLSSVMIYNIFQHLGMNYMFEFDFSMFKGKWPAWTLRKKWLKV